MAALVRGRDCTFICIVKGKNDPNLKPAKRFLWVFFCQGPWISLCIVLCNRDDRQMWSGRKVLIGFLQPVEVRLVHWGEVWDSLQANLTGADTLWETGKKCLAVSGFMVVLWWFKEKNQPTNQTKPPNLQTHFPLCPEVLGRGLPNSVGQVQRHALVT